MGYDIYGDGEVTIPADKVAAAGAALHAHCVKETIIETEVVPSYGTAYLLSRAIRDLSDGRFSADEIRPLGGVLMGPDQDDGAVRNIDDIKWIFDVLAPFVSGGAFSWRGEDDYRFCLTTVGSMTAYHRSSTSSVRLSGWRRSWERRPSD